MYPKPLPLSTPLGDILDQLGQDIEEIVAAIARARESISTNLTAVAKDAGIDVKTVKSYEGKRDRGAKDPNWIAPIRYLRYLAGATPKARAEVLQILGIEAVGIVGDPDLDDGISDLKMMWDMGGPARKAAERALDSLRDSRAFPAERAEKRIRGPNTAPARASHAGP